jgi:hypothetical protein
MHESLPDARIQTIPCPGQEFPEQFGVAFFPLRQDEFIIPQHLPNRPGVFIGNGEDCLQIALPEEIVNPAFDGEEIGLVRVASDRCRTGVEQ